MMRRLQRSTLPLLLLAAVATARADGPPVAPATQPVLFLSDGGFLAGAAVDSTGPDVLRWKNESFTSALWFASGRVAAARWPSPPVVPKPAGPFLFETAGGDVLYGALVRLDEKTVEFDAPPLGRVRLDRARLRRFGRSQGGGELLYAGPNGLAGWKGDGWRDEGGDLSSSVLGATVRGDVKLPARADVELEVSWAKRPNFTIAFGPADGDDGLRRAFRLEVWDDDLVAVAETHADADLVMLAQVSDNPGRIHLRVLLDPVKGRYVVVTPEGKKRADLKIGPRADKPSGIVALVNGGGDVRVERLRVSQWDGTLPDEPGADANRAHVRRTNGLVIAADSVSFDNNKQELVITDDLVDDEHRIALDEVAGVRFPAKADDASRSIRLVAHDGARVAGGLVKIADNAVWLAVPGVAEPVKMPITALRSLHRIAELSAPKTSPGQAGVLEIDGLRLHGWLEDGQGAPGTSCLVWRPAASTNASSLRPDATGRIIYKEPPPPKPVATPTRVNQRVMAVQAQMRVVINGRVVTKPYEPPVAVDPGRKMIHLRTGDMIVGDVVKIDEEGVWYKSASSDNTFIPHAKIKAVELGPSVRRTVVLSRTKYDRLLTLPRLQRGSPPTHLLRSTNGDYLRGRVVGLDAKTLKFEVRLEVRDLPRDRVARITWLHADETDPAKAVAPPAVDPASTRVQAVTDGGLRLTFFADKFADGRLSGKSDVVGVCRVKLDEVHQILFGRAIEASASNLAAQQWRLHNAPDPKFAQDTGDGGEDPSAGTESELVGKPAPDFTLDLLAEGKKFHLNEAKGTVLILDFWATWCGPCLQAMPQVDKVAAEFKDKGVRLVAVNLQEAPAQITALLERLKLHPEVALDRDGAVAAKYKAVAIPQTVVIDRDGKISRLFVGSSSDLADRLRDALKAATGDAPKKPEEPKK